MKRQDSLHSSDSFPRTGDVSDHLFNLVHCNKWGPYSIESHGGHRNFLTIVDDSTRLTRAYLLYSKSHACQIFPTFVSTQFVKVIKQFMPDNACELEFEELFAEHGVLHQFTLV